MLFKIIIFFQRYFIEYHQLPPTSILLIILIVFSLDSLFAGSYFIDFAAFDGHEIGRWMLIVHGDGAER